MIDDLDLAFDERAEKGRHRRGFARKRNKKGGGRAKTVIALLMTVLLLGALGGGAWYGFDRIQGYFSTPDYPGPGKGEVVVQVKAGQFVAEIGNNLVTADVVKSAKAFIEASNDNPHSTEIQVGSYKLRKQMKAADALTLLLDPKSRQVNGVTIPEGLMSLEIYDKLSQFTKIPVADFKKAAADPVKLGVPASWFKRNDGKKISKSIEGFLYPATYEIPPKATAEQILGLMVQQFLQVTTDMKFVETVQNSQLHISPYEALIAASIAQAESVHHEDMAKVARVIYNRVYTDSSLPCKCVGIDSAINYSFRIQGKPPKDSDDLTNSELHDKKNPYNTHDVPGLPPTPISNPGEVAIKGAMNPPAGPWIYFMTTDKEGKMGYGTTDADFRNLQREMCKNGVLTGTNC